MPPAFPVTSTNSFPAVTDLCFSALRMPSSFGLPSAITEIHESSVAFIETVKACFEMTVESEDVESEEEPCLVVESLAAVFDTVSESLLEGEGAGEAAFPPGSMEFFFSGVGLGAGTASLVFGVFAVFVCDPWPEGDCSGAPPAGAVVTAPCESLVTLVTWAPCCDLYLFHNAQPPAAAASSSNATITGASERLGFRGGCARSSSNLRGNCSFSSDSRLPASAATKSATACSSSMPRKRA